MANEKRLIDANALAKVAEKRCGVINIKHIDEAPTVDAVEVARLEEVKQEILQTLDVLIAMHRNISNSRFANPEKHFGIPESSKDYYGIYADVMEIARRLVNAALTDLCSYGERRDGE